MGTHRNLMGLAALLLAALLPTVVACRSTGLRSGTAQNTYVGGEGLETEELVGNRSLAKDLEMTQVRSERRDGRLHVQFELHNKRTANLAIEWTVDWFDDGGFRIDWPRRWSPVSLVGQGYNTIAFTAPVPEASQWRFAVEYPNAIR